MGRAMGFSVVAEGVETKDQLDILNELGCDAAQGFFLAEPMGAEKLIEHHFSG